MPDSASLYGKIGVVLGGGSYKGFIQALRLYVFMQWMETNQLRIFKIYAGSVGAYNGTALAENPGLGGAEKLLKVWGEVLALGERFYKKHPFLEEKLRNFIPHSPFHKHASWNELRRDCKNQLLNLINFISFVSRIFWTGIYFLRKGEMPSSAKKVGDIIDHFFGIEAKAFFDPSPLLAVVRRRIDFQKIIDSEVEFLVLAESFGNAKPFIFSNHDRGMGPDRMFKCVTASAALYPFFEMVEIDGTEYLDGDIANPFPAELAFRTCDTIFVFLNTPARLERKRGTLLEDLALHSTMRDYKIIFDGIVKAQRVAKAEGKNVFIFRPKFVHPGLGLLSISKEAIAFHRANDPPEMEKYFINIEKYNLRHLPDIEMYRANPDLYSELDNDIKNYLRNL